VDECKPLELGTQVEEEDEMARLVCFGAFSTAAVGIQYYKGRAMRTR
jgi:hypothetical protein